MTVTLRYDGETFDSVDKLLDKAVGPWLNRYGEETIGETFDSCVDVIDPANWVEAFLDEIFGINTRPAHPDDFPKARPDIPAVKVFEAMLRWYRLASCEPDAMLWDREGSGEEGEWKYGRLQPRADHPIAILSHWIVNQRHTNSVPELDRRLAR